MTETNQDLFTLQMLGNDAERRIFLELQKNEMSGYDLVDKTKLPQTTVYRKLKHLQKTDLVLPVRVKRMSHEVFCDVLHSRIQIDVRNGEVEITYTPK
ncbi:MAG: winged helix-turn-helix domain-containing protein [Nitrosopumilus sp.]|nr:winged helix-turn-helix domain-containing protein [Nitrosopumilus sp.]MDH3822266.1 winged helix-turn-helix domain-containing protein [Nitrosopumilus sp.]MDH3833067.1 winged helix-turn-helix domain-containing protein [Nitrosopumilus sp.]